MTASRQLHRWCGSALLALALVAGSGVAIPAQADGGQLRITLAVCPMGSADSGLEACATRLARAFRVSVLDEAMAPVSEDVAAGVGGEVVIDLAPGQSGRLRVIAQTAINVGARSVSCRAGGEPVAAALAGAGAAIPIFWVDVPPAADIDCVVSLFGFPNDDELLDIVAGHAAATPAAGTPSPATPVAGRPSAATPLATAPFRMEEERS